MIKTRGNLYLRFFDRYVGIALVWILSWFKKKRTLPSSIQTIGILKLAGIGDLIVLSGVIHDIKKTYPEADIILFCGNENRAIAPFIPGIKTIEPIQVLKFSNAIKTLRSHHLDVLFDFEQWSRIDALLTFFSNARYVVGFKTVGQAKHYLFDSPVLHIYECHEIENFRRMIRSVGIPSETHPIVIFPETPISPLKPYVLFHPWSISRVKGLKEWPKASWMALGMYLKEKGCQIYITGGQNDMLASENMAEEIGGISLAGKTSFAELAQYIEEAVCTISVDTGVMHLAAALTKPLVALFGPTSPKRWGPLSSRAITVSGGHPYMYLGFEIPPQQPDCMSLITLEQVIAAFETFQIQD